MILFAEELCSPVFLQPPPSCMQTTAGYTVDIVCVASGNPTPNVWWVKDNVTITGPQVGLREGHLWCGFPDSPSSSLPQSAVGSSSSYEQLSDNTLRVHSVRQLQQFHF